MIHHLNVRKRLLGLNLRIVRKMIHHLNVRKRLLELNLRIVRKMIHHLNIRKRLLLLSQNPKKRKYAQNRINTVTKLKQKSI
ncbi:hypothetical protein BVH62_08580 [Vibrio cholerae]|nr:hypothetical protein [Vibrio cholerae]